MKMSGDYAYSESRANEDAYPLAKGTTATASSPSSSATPPAQPAGRQIIYMADLTLVVESTSETIQRVKSMAEAAGGFLQSLGQRSITVKIPAAKFYPVLTEVKKLGEVTGEEVTGLDVTDKMRDSRIRLNNAEETRKRLVTFLDRATNATEAVMVEREINRVTEQIELLKGELAMLEEKVAYSTLIVHVNSPIPQRQVKEEVPFPWVRGLGSELLRGGAVGYASVNEGAGVHIHMPAGFAKYDEKDNVTRAVSAEGVYLKAERHKNAKGGDIDFWSKLARRVVVEQQTIAMSKDMKDTKLEYSVPCRMLEGVRETDRGKMAYFLALAVTEDDVFTVEAWGPVDKLNEVKPAIEKALPTMDVQWCGGVMYDWMF